MPFLDPKASARAGRISGSRRRADHVITWIHRGPLTEQDRARIAAALQAVELLDAECKPDAA